MGGIGYIFDPDYGSVAHINGRFLYSWKVTGKIDGKEVARNYEGNDAEEIRNRAREEDISIETLALNFGNKK